MSDTLTESFKIRMTSEMRKEIQALADADDRTLSAMIRKMLKDMLELEQDARIQRREDQDTYDQIVAQGLG